MKIFKIFLILFLIFSLWNFCLPRLSFPQVGNIEPEITKHPPEMRSSAEQNFPVGETEKRKTWIWWVVGILVVGGAIAIASTAGGGGGGGGNGSSGGNSGSVTLGW
jgi:hypothetical protein